MQKSNKLQLLIAIVPLELKDNLVDVFITLECLSGFSLSKIQGYSREHHHYNLLEQVEGYRDFYRFELQHEEQDRQQLLDQIAANCPAGKIRYWCLPILEIGIV